MLEKDKAALLSQPFVRFAPFFAAGMLTVYFGGEPWSASVLAAALAALLFAVFRAKKKKRAGFWLCAAGAVCGVILMTCYTRFYVKPLLSHAGDTVSAEIFVSEVRSVSGQTETLLAKTKLGGKTARLRLTCGQPLPEGYSAEVVIELGAADIENTAENLSNEIFLTGEITEIISSEYKGTGIAGFFRTLKRNFEGKLLENVFGESAELASAMLFGDSARLSPEYYEYLRVSGAAHYTAVSGAHFTILAAVILSLLPQSRRKLRFWASLMFAPAALLFFGLSPSVLRASVMFFVYSLGMLFHKRSHPLNSLCIALTIIPLFSPTTILDAGFAMSVLGVFGAGVIGPALSEKTDEFIPEKGKAFLSPVVKALVCSACAVICTAPISAALFKCVSIAGVLTSLLLAPLMAAAMTFMLLLGATQLRFLAVPIDWSMKLSCAVIRAFGRCRVFTLSLDFKGAVVLTSALALAVSLCAFGTLKYFSRLLRLSGIILLMIPAVSIIVSQGRHEIYFTGYSASSAAIVIDKNSARVFIAGGGDGLSERISRVLRERGAYKITEIFAPDLNYGGALSVKSLTKTVKVGSIVSNELASGLLPEREITLCGDETVFSASGVTIAAANASSSPNADVALYTGRMNKVTESSARAAVYFASKEYELPDNFYNARLVKDFYIKL